MSRLRVSVGPWPLGRGAALGLLCAAALAGCAAPAAPVASAPPPSADSPGRSPPLGRADSAAARDVAVATTFMRRLIAADRPGYTAVTHVPFAWGDRCTWIVDRDAFHQRVVAQQPPAGRVRVARAAPISADPAGPGDQSVAAAFADLKGSCGSAQGDARLATLRGGATPRFVRVTLATPAGPHVVILRLMRIDGVLGVNGLAD